MVVTLPHAYFRAHSRPRTRDRQRACPELLFEEPVGRALIDEETFMPRSVFDQRHRILFSPGTRILTEISFESFHAPGHFRATTGLYALIDLKRSGLRRPIVNAP